MPLCSLSSTLVVLGCQVGRSTTHANDCGDARQHMSNWLLTTPSRVMAATTTTVAATASRDILLYAELLTNIRQITVKASLPTPADQTTKAEIFDLGHKFRIEHGGVIRELGLPAQAPLAGALPTSHKGSVDLTWRVPVRPQEAQKRHFVPENQPLPWTAADIQHGSATSCRDCGACIVEQGKVQAWKDLPSENWAEMMEFWHCHKPVDDDKPEDGTLQQRGYGAATTIAAQQGVGFVDMTSLLFCESDCQNLLVGSRKHFTFFSSFFFSFLPCHGELEGGQVEAIAFQCPGHRYNSPRSIALILPPCGQLFIGVPSLADGLPVIRLLLHVPDFHLGRQSAGVEGLTEIHPIICYLYSKRGLLMTNFL